MNKTQKRIKQALKRKQAQKYYEVGFPQTLKEAKKVGAFDIETDKEGEILSYTLPLGLETVLIDEFILECEAFERDLEEEINMTAKINTPEYQLSLTNLIEIYGKGGLNPK